MSRKSPSSLLPFSQHLAVNVYADLQKAGFDLCIIDEAHHSAAPTYEKLVRELGFMSDDPKKMLLGVTATPKRGDGVGLSSIFQEIVFNRSIAWGIKNSYLSPLSAAGSKRENR